jgi:hypothetical protein
MSRLSGSYRVMSQPYYTVVVEVILLDQPMVV